MFRNSTAIAKRAAYVPLTAKQLKRARVNFQLAVKAANRT
jgi:hypothetical protein